MWFYLWKVPFPCRSHHDPVVWSLRQVSWFPLPMNLTVVCYFLWDCLHFTTVEYCIPEKGLKHFFLELLLTKPAFQVVVQENGAHNIVHSAAIFGGHFNYGSEARTYLPWVSSMQSQVGMINHNKFFISDHMLYCLHYCCTGFLLALLCLYMLQATPILSVSSWFNLVSCVPEWLLRAGVKIMWRFACYAIVTLFDFQIVLCLKFLSDWL